MGRQSTRATSVDRPAASHLRPPHGASPRLIKRQRCWRVDRRWQILRLAPSNAGAASESTTAGSLEAFSQGTAGTERIENANSKLRWSLSPPLSVSYEMESSMKGHAMGQKR